ncbi:dsDNA nuclease domain-containing protein [Nocardioides sp. W7]|uniref:dsDNA nuclease domain-containing protein n=1 Tax=Nocardioides sp. W7 TaxID=2931390 RepID=UPI001FD361D6|nr:dsDNA nuclease domain-containing protein [Nocardioides sp. W7]
MSIEDGGRRSRRGFAYQDAVTLMECLNLGTLYTSVGFEAEDDIVCTQHDRIIYRQVKTRENAEAHSAARVCRPEVKGKVETSILGRLFSGKDEPIGEVTFCVVLNEPPTQTLWGFKHEGPCGTAPADEKSRQDVATKLIAMHLPDWAPDIDFLVDRLEVQVLPRTADDLEKDIIGRLEDPVTKQIGQKPLLDELAKIAELLLSKVAREARRRVARSWTADEFWHMFADVVTEATGEAANGTLPLVPLAEKLDAAGLDDEEIRRSFQELESLRRMIRSAVGAEKVRYKELNREVFAICQRVAAHRRAGKVQPGPAAYSAVVDALDTDINGTLGTSADRMATLSDVTYRCQNRYA